MNMNREEARTKGEVGLYGQRAFNEQYAVNHIRKLIRIKNYKRIEKNK